MIAGLDTGAHARNAGRIRRDAVRSSESSRDAKGPLGLNVLFDPPGLAVADLIFVHGLGGGSRSTWTKSLDSSVFWPQEWLPEDPAFKDVRIHTFGYDSNWGKKSILNIHDFAKSLLGSIQDCPSMSHDLDIPLIFVGHSMGGLVIKKAYILAQQYKDFDALAKRVRSIFFLATPHRGSDLAPLLSKLLSITFGARPFVRDLHRNSLATQSINDEFPHHSQNLHLFSFYETLPTSYGVGKSIIVDKDLATLGYPNERTEYINANHRDICKYSTKSDPNYLTVRNALAFMVEKLRSHSSQQNRKVDIEQRRRLDRFLNISDAAEDDLIEVDARRMTGTCEWLIAKKSFQTWRDSTGAQIYWVSAKPAAGKTVLSGFIIKHLQDHSRDCSFYFFDSSDKAKSTIATLLRSMARQMAIQSAEILQAIMEISEKDGQVDVADYRKIWRKLYLDGIFKVTLHRPQYWVIDALDECKNDSELIPLLLKVSELYRIRIFVTSRNIFQSSGNMLSSKISVLSEEILEDDTRNDISLYLKANLHCIPSVDEEERQNTAAKILAKSSGCFLWVSLVLKELMQVHTAAEVAQLLEDVPSDMDTLYSRILQSMSRKPYGKPLAKAIIVWTICSAKPLTTTELHHALQLDMNDGIDRIEKAITSSCGQLVYVDKSLRVHMVHQTARGFLLRSSTTSEFAIDKKSGHKRLAMTCLRYLCGSETKTPKHRKLSINNVRRPNGPLADYACSSLFEHIAHVSSEDTEFLLALVGFLNSPNILAWIEYLVQNSNLRCLIQTARSLRKYLQRISMHLSPIGKDVATLDSWATDLIRLVSKFGKNLSDFPSSIFNLVPPFCPPESALRKQFAASKRGITVFGLSTATWGDRLSTIVQPGEQLTALACSSDYFVIGSSTGRLVVYHEMTCQEAQTLQHLEIVKTLQFGKRGQLLASAGMKMVQLWDVNSWQQLWSFDITHQCLSLGFTDEDRLLLAALSGNTTMVWDVTSGLLRESANWTDDYQNSCANAYRRPVMATISADSSLLAVVYRGQDICVWDIERNLLYATYSKATGAQSATTRARDFVTGGLTFSRDPDATLLAASYSDGELVVFDTHEGTVKEKALAYAQTVASSVDGRTLATADSLGTLQIFDFETLRLLYRINSEEHSIKALAFNGDSNRLLDIRGSECRVWDPTVLIRSDVDDESSDTVAVSTAPQEISLEPPEEVVLITSLACHDGGEIFFCGKSDGSIHIYDTFEGLRNQELVSHASGVSVILLSFDSESQCLISVDASSRVMSHRLLRQNRGWEASDASFDMRFNPTAVEQVLCNGGHTRLLVCSATKDILFEITSDGSKALETISWDERGPHRWGTHPSNSHQLILICDGKAHMYDWRTFQRLTGVEGIMLDGSIPPGFSIRSMTACAGGARLATVFSESLGSRSKSRVTLWGASSFSEESQSAAPISDCQLVADQFQVLIGAYGQRLVYLHSNGWICTMDLGSLAIEAPARHFFIPLDWLSAGVDMMIEVTCRGDILFVKGQEVAVVKRGLETNEDGLSSVRKRPLLARVKSQDSDNVFLRPPLLHATR